MRGTVFGNSDIELYLTEDELTFLGIIKIGEAGGKRKIVYESLECCLQNPDGSDFGEKIHLQHYAPSDEKDVLGDGIGVEFKEGTYFVKMTDRVSSILEGSGTFETRYGAGEKITINIS